MKILNIKRCFIIIILLLAIECAISGFIGVWRDWYWSSLSDKHFNLWMLYIAEFSGAAILGCWVSGYGQYVANITALDLRTKLTRKALKLQSHLGIEGGNQRVQEDCMAYPTLLINFIVGSTRSAIMLIVFTIIVLHSVPAWYLIIPFAYTVVGTLLAGKIAIPLINLNYINQVFEAKFRQILTKNNYKDVHRNNFKLFKRTKFLAYFQSFYNQITVIMPHIALIGLYFSGKITFGIFMQIAASFAEMINSMSYLINSFGDINKLLSCRRRLKEIKLI